MTFKRTTQILLSLIALFTLPTTLASAPEHDFIVVGSGAGGGPVAARLASKGYRVLLLEAGSDTGDHFDYQIPIFNPFSAENPLQSWNFYVDHYSDPNKVKKERKSVCSTLPEPSPAASLKQCIMQSDGDCKCPITHPYRHGILYPRASALGGSTAHHAMIGMLPEAAEWNYIANHVGDSSWDAASMRPYADKVSEWIVAKPPKSDDFLEFEDDKVETILHSVIDTAQPANIPADADLKTVLDQNVNDTINETGDAEGVWPLTLTVENGRRRGTREHVLKTACMVDVSQPIGFRQTQAELDAYCEANGLIDPETGKPFLTIKTGAFVSKVLFAENPKYNFFTRKWTCNEACKTAVGVEYLDKEFLYEASPKSQTPLLTDLYKRKVYAQSEVIISAGVFNTPQILMLSGIGPKEELDRSGINIPVRVNSPGVGQNLQDKAEISVVSDIEDIKINEICSIQNPIDNDCLLEWKASNLLTGIATGFYTSTGSPLSLAHKTEHSDQSDIFVFGGPVDFRGYEPNFTLKAALQSQRWSWLILKANTNNRAGTITLRSNDPFDTPVINFNYFGDGDQVTLSKEPELGIGGLPSERDLNAMVEGIRLVRDIMDKAAEDGGYNFTEVSPGRDISTDTDLKAWIESEVFGHHGSSSAKMGADDDSLAVLDSDFKVRGVNNLRVVDASVFPKALGIYISGGIYMASEKAADAISADHPL